MAKGIKTGGRKKGTPNKNTLSVKERCAELKCDYTAYLAHVVNNTLPCRVCRGKGSTKFQPAGSERFQGERTCQSCWGSKLEKISPELGLQAAVRLMERCEPQLKAIEVSGSDKKPPIGFKVVLVKPGGNGNDDDK